MSKQKISLSGNRDYRAWLIELKSTFRDLQLKAAVSVNRTLLDFYWQLGRDIVDKQARFSWGDGFFTQLSGDLRRDFPEVKGFSVRNLQQIRQWYVYWNDPDVIALQPVAQLHSIPWGHNLIIIAKCAQRDQALYYVQNAIAHNWSRSVLVHQIESGLWQRQAKAISNFSATLPAKQSDLARQILKDPYIFDFLSLTGEHSERELELALTQQITQFLLELGAGFAYLGRQVPLQVGSREFFIDLLFYHTRLRCYLVVELKTTEFEPEYAGKLNFYIRALDEQLRQAEDQPSIGLLLCKHKDKLVAEYALSDMHNPMGVASYDVTQILPDLLKDSLPSIAQLEAELCAALADKSEKH